MERERETDQAEDNARDRRTTETIGDASKD